MILLLLVAGMAQAAEPGTVEHYRPVSAAPVEEFSILYGPDNWKSLRARKAGGVEFRLWAQGGTRYVWQEAGAAPREYRHPEARRAVLPASIPWSQLLPQGADEVTYLGQRYRRTGVTQEPWTPPPPAKVVLLRDDVLVGAPHNRKQKDETRRWDGSDYEYVPLTRDDYRRMAESGINWVNVDDSQLAWADELGLFYWGAAKSMPWPEILYRSQYLGPTQFLDEPAVGTRDHVLRPRLAKDPSFRKTITPLIAFDAFRAYYSKALDSRTQPNLYTWETMPETALYQLSQRPDVPAAFVFEPPGRVGSRRTLPEWNMVYGTHFATGDARALTSVLFSFLRGAARLTGKQWGVSIYGAVESADAAFWLTEAYDLGATRFHFWDSYRLACVPFGEMLDLARHLQRHVAGHPQHPRRAEVLLTLPPGYGLGHTHMGRGNLWGVPELNLERKNAHGVPHRTVMSRFFREAERLMRRGVMFDAAWDLPGLDPAGYAQVVRIRENDRSALPEIPTEGKGPELTVRAALDGAHATASAAIVEGAAPVFYTHGADASGVYRNAEVLWELFGPEDEDYRMLGPGREITFALERPGRYRLRAAVCDTAGRSSVVWRTLVR